MMPYTSISITVKEDFMVQIPSVIGYYRLGNRKGIWPTKTHATCLENLSCRASEKSRLAHVHQKMRLKWKWVVKFGDQKGIQRANKSWPVSVA